MAGAFGNAGGDGSDSDIEEIAQGAADDAYGAMLSYCSNPGMEALAELVGDEIDSQAAGLVDDAEPDLDGLISAVAGVHSADTAMSCMTEGCQEAYSILMDAYLEIIAHEAAEGD
jgi:hypothetical protein